MATITAATATDLQTLYVAYFNRPADPVGLQSWLNQGSSVAQIAAGFSASTEYKTTYAGKSPLDMVDSIYLNLFGRHAEAAGLTYWAGKLTAGTETFASIVLTIANSAQNDDLVSINNKVAAATAFTTSLDTAEKIRGYDGDAANAVAKAWLATVTTDASLTAATTATALTTVATAAAQAHEGTLNTPQTFTLSASVDAGAAFTGGAGNDTFNGNATTLSALDQLDGGAGSDSLNLFSVNKDGVATSLDLSLPTSVKNIENLVVTSTTSALAGNAADVSAWAGLTNATFNVKGNAQTITVADTTAVTATNTQGVTVVGGSNATVTSSDGASTAATAAAAATTAAATAATAATASTAAAALAAATITAQTAAVAADSTNGAADDNLIAIKAAFTGVALSAAQVTAVAAATTDAGALALIAGFVTTNNTAAATAATAATAAATASTAAAAAAAAAVTNGAISVAGDALVSATVVGGTTVSVTDNGEDTLTTVSLKGHNGAATLTGDALTTVSLASTSAAANIVNTTAKHTLNLGVNAVTGGATITDGAATTVNLTVTGAKATTASNINLTANSATTLNIDTAAALTLDPAGLAAAGVLKTVTVKGAGSLSADLSGVASLTSVDMSAGSGKHTVTVDGTIAAAAIKGGSGVDVVSVNGALNAKSTIALGAGNDTYKFSTAAAAGAVVTGGDGTDTLAVTNGTTLLDANAAKVYSGFEVLEVAGGQGNYDMSILGLTAVTLTGTALANTANITSAAASTTVGITAAASTDFTTGQSLTYALKDAAGKADALSLSLNAVDGNNNGAANGKVTVTSVTANSIETINVASNATADVADGANLAVAANKYVNTITTLIADSATKVVVTGAASTVLTTIQSDTITKIDASAATGNVTVTNAVLATAGGANAALNAVTYIGGSGVDTYTATAKGDVFFGGAGADVVTLGNGKDTVALTKASDSILTLKDTNTPADGISDTATGYDTINSFTSGSDKIDISSLNIATGSARGSITLHTASADTAAALQTAIGTGTGFFNDGVANRALSLVTGDGNSYLFIDANNDGNYTAGTDAVIKLVGVTALVLTDVAFG